MRFSKAIAAAVSGLAVGLSAAGMSPAQAQENTVVTVPAARTVMSAADRANAKSRLPMLTKEQFQRVMGAEGRGFGVDSGNGVGVWPFTTKGAYGSGASGYPTRLAPWRTTGKLWTRYGASWFVCTASSIKKGLVVTAAHCIADYGTSTVPDEVVFEPARFGSDVPWGEWSVSNIVAPSVYYAGTDDCEVAGIVCANDVAILVMNTNGSGQYPGQKTGFYGYYTDNFGWPVFLGRRATQITQLGYPQAFDGGEKMIRTDSLGLQFSPNNVLIGSDQTGGSSGGPWIMNFGQDPVSESTAPSYNARNRVVATTSWGYTDPIYKVQGASRFAKNSKYPTVPNIQSLIDTACASFPTRC